MIIRDSQLNSAILRHASERQIRLVDNDPDVAAIVAICNECCYEFEEQLEAKEAELAEALGDDDFYDEYEEKYDTLKDDFESTADEIQELIDDIENSESIDGEVMDTDVILYRLNEIMSGIGASI